MTPDYQIIADSQDVTDTIRGRLLLLSVTDVAGMRSDTVEIQLDDRDGIEIPRTGATLEVSLGYKETGIAKMGTFVVDEVEMASPPATMIIRAKAGDMTGTLKSCQKRSWDSTTIGDIVSAIAAEHGYTARVSDDLAAISIEHLDQTYESDANLLTRLAKEKGAVFKPAGGYLLFVNNGETKSASGKDLPSIELTPSEEEKWSVTNAGRNRYGKVIARYRDLDAAQDVYVTAGSSEPAYCIRNAFKDQAAAQKAADAKLKSLSRKTQTLSLSRPGNPEVAAEAKLSLTGFRTGVDGEWTIKRAVHKIAKNSGYTTSIEAEIKQ